MNLSPIPWNQFICPQLLGSREFVPNYLELELICPQILGIISEFVPNYLELEFICPNLLGIRVNFSPKLECARKALT